MRSLSWIALLALTTTAQANTWNEMHSCVTQVGDCNGDGVPDLAVAGRDVRRGPRYGTRFLRSEIVRVISGKSGELLWQATGAAPGDGFGTSLSPAGDFDGDGHADLVVGALALTDNPGDGLFAPIAVGVSYVRVLSGRDGHVLFEQRGQTHSEWIGYSTGASEDLDGDGRPDLLLGVPDRTKSSSCRVISAREGKVLLRVESPDGVKDFGRTVTFVGDVDGDHRTDIAVAARGDDVGVVFLVSGKDGSTIRSLKPSTPSWSFGWSMSAWRDPVSPSKGWIAIGAEDESVHIFDSTGAQQLGRHAGRGATALDKKLDGYATTLDCGVLEPELGPWVLVGTDDLDRDEGRDGYAELVSPDGKAARPIGDAPRQGIDVCFAGDVDGDGVQEIALVSLGDEILRVQSVKKNAVLRTIALRDLTPNKAK